MSSPTSPQLSPRKGKFILCKVYMLDDSTHTFQIPHKALGKVLFEEVAKKLHLLESDYFDLEYLDHSENYANEQKTCWLDHEKPVLKQLSINNLLFKFLVKFYTPDPGLLEDEFTRYLFALQIKRDLATGAMPCQEHTAVLLASYIVQSEIGDFIEEEYTNPAYLEGLKLLPNQTEELDVKIMEHHREHVGQTPAEADFNLLDTARKVELYGIRMHPAKDHEGVPLHLAVAHMGVLVFQSYTKINTFSWAKVRKLSFKRKKFLIKLHPDGYVKIPAPPSPQQGYYKDTVEFYFETRNECKNFWKKCIEHHAFFRCHSVKRIPRNKTRVVSRGSSFRYSGKTQKQLVEYVRDNYIKRPPFERSTSLRTVSTTNRSMGGTLNSREFPHNTSSSTGSHTLERSRSSRENLDQHQRSLERADVHNGHVKQQPHDYQGYPPAAAGQQPRSPGGEKRQPPTAPPPDYMQNYDAVQQQMMQQQQQQQQHDQSGEQSSRFNYDYYQLSYDYVAHPVTVSANQNANDNDQFEVYHDDNVSHDSYLLSHSRDDSIERELDRETYSNELYIDEDKLMRELEAEKKAQEEVEVLGRLELQSKDWSKKVVIEHEADDTDADDIDMLDDDEGDPISRQVEEELENEVLNKIDDSSRESTHDDLKEETQQTAVLENEVIEDDLAATKSSLFRRMESSERRKLSVRQARVEEDDDLLAEDKIIVKLDDDNDTVENKDNNDTHVTNVQVQDDIEKEEKPEEAPTDVKQVDDIIVEERAKVLETSIVDESIDDENTKSNADDVADTATEVVADEDKEDAYDYEQIVVVEIPKESVSQELEKVSDKTETQKVNQELEKVSDEIETQKVNDNDQLAQDEESVKESKPSEEEALAVERGRDTEKKKIDDDIPYILHRRHFSPEGVLESRRPPKTLNTKRIASKSPSPTRPLTREEQKARLDKIKKSLTSPIIPHSPSKSPKSPNTDSKSPSSHRAFELVVSKKLPPIDSFSCIDDTLSPSAEEEIIGKIRKKPYMEQAVDHEEKKDAEKSIKQDSEKVEQSDKRFVDDVPDNKDIDDQKDKGDPVLTKEEHRIDEREPKIEKEPPPVLQRRKMIPPKAEMEDLTTTEDSCSTEEIEKIAKLRDELQEAADLKGDSGSEVDSLPADRDSGTVTPKAEHSSPSKEHHSVVEKNIDDVKVKSAEHVEEKKEGGLLKESEQKVEEQKLCSIHNQNRDDQNRKGESDKKGEQVKEEITSEAVGEESFEESIDNVDKSEILKQDECDLQMKEEYSEDIKNKYEKLLTKQVSEDFPPPPPPIVFEETAPAPKISIPTFSIELETGSVSPEVEKATSGMNSCFVPEIVVRAATPLPPSSPESGGEDESASPDLPPPPLQQVVQQQTVHEPTVKPPSPPVVKPPTPPTDQPPTPPTIAPKPDMSVRPKDPYSSRKPTAPLSFMEEIELRISDAPKPVSSSEATKEEDVPSVLAAYSGSSQGSALTSMDSLDLPLPPPPLSEHHYISSGDEDDDEHHKMNQDLEDDLANLQDILQSQAQANPYAVPIAHDMPTPPLEGEHEDDNDEDDGNTAAGGCLPVPSSTAHYISSDEEVMQPENEDLELESMSEILKSHVLANPYSVPLSVGEHHISPIIHDSGSSDSDDIEEALASASTRALMSPPDKRGGARMVISSDSDEDVLGPDSSEHQDVSHILELQAQANPFAIPISGHCEISQLEMSSEESEGEGCIDNAGLLESKVVVNPYLQDSVVHPDVPKVKTEAPHGDEFYKKMGFTPKDYSTSTATAQFEAESESSDEEIRTEDVGGDLDVLETLEGLEHKSDSEDEKQPPLKIPVAKKVSGHEADESESDSSSESDFEQVPMVTKEQMSSSAHSDSFMFANPLAEEQSAEMFSNPYAQALDDTPPSPPPRGSSQQASSQAPLSPTQATPPPAQAPPPTPPKPLSNNSNGQR